MKRLGHPSIIRICIGNPEGQIKGQWQFRICIAYFEFIFTLIDWYLIKDELDILNEKHD